MTQIDTDLKAVAIKEVHPTQMTAGHAWMEKKRKKFKGLTGKALEQQASNEFFPGVIGPNKGIYITDHHHGALAVLKSAPDAKVKVGIQDDLSMLSEIEFWIFMDHRTWVHCYDVTGRRQAFSAMPRTLAEMADDPYRTLAAEVRDRGGFAKSDLPYLEFLWANYFRERMAKKLVRTNSSKAIGQAIKLARDQDAAYLPGWVGEP